MRRPTNFRYSHDKLHGGKNFSLKFVIANADKTRWSNTPMNASKHFFAFFFHYFVYTFKTSVIIGTWCLLRPVAKSNDADITYIYIRNSTGVSYPVNHVKNKKKTNKLYVKLSSYAEESKFSRIHSFFFLVLFLPMIISYTCKPWSNLHHRTQAVHTLILHLMQCNFMLPRFR